MAICEKFEKCPFYQGKMSTESGLGAIYKQKYCEGDKSTCARYMVSTTLGPEYVTLHLYPNMIDQANKLIEENKK